MSELSKKERYIKISNGSTTMIIDRKGAQPVSVEMAGLPIFYTGALEAEYGTDAHGNAKPAPTWSATAKNLFPNPGPIGTYNEKYGKTIIDPETGKEKEHQLKSEGKFVEYGHNGGLYKDKQHGFAQDEIFTVTGKNKSDCVLTISSQLKDYYDKYPYKFGYSVVYDIPQPGKIKYESHVINMDNKPIVAGQGWHPGFLLHGKPQNYLVVIENLQKIDDSCELEEGQVISIWDKAISLDENGKKRKAATYTGIKSADVRLVYFNPETQSFIDYLTMHTNQPNLLLWSAPATEKGQDNFISIEPWNTSPRILSQLTTQDKTPELAQKGARIVDSALRADEKDDFLDELEVLNGGKKFTDEERRHIREVIELEDDKLETTITVNPEYVKYMLNAKELGSAAER